MNKLFHSVAIIFFIACSSDNEGLDPHLIAPELAITELTATGSVAEQTVAQAKKTIYGKWDIVNSSRSYSTTKSNACAFDFIEFTDDAYLMALIVDGDREVAFGTYDMNEDASGNVTSVDLNFNLGTSGFLSKLNVHFGSSIRSLFFSFFTFFLKVSYWF